VKSRILKSKNGWVCRLQDYDLEREFKYKTDALKLQHDLDGMDELLVRGSFTLQPWHYFQRVVEEGRYPELIQEEANDNLFELIAEDLSHLGGPMGSEYTTDSSIGLFKTETSAQEKAEKCFKKKLSWRRDGKRLVTDNIGSVRYRIIPRKVS